MLLKPKPQPKNVCDKPNVSSTRHTIPAKTPKKVLISKNWHRNCSHEVKTLSDRVIRSKEQEDKPTKATVSLSPIPKEGKVLDFSSTCGDAVKTKTRSARVSNTTTNSTYKNNDKTCLSSTKENKPGNIQTDMKVDTKTKIVEEYYKKEKFGKCNSSKIQRTSTRSIKIKTKKNDGTLKNVAKEKVAEHVLQEHYLNENFANLYDSTYDIDTIMRNGQTFDTINEVNEKQASSGSKTAVPNDKESKLCIIEDLEDELTLKRLKEFREKNYFECHSSRSRVKTKASAISIKEHKCRYRLYLNDRLFPVAIDDDHTGNIRCVDCHLPLKTSDNDKPNGTIQAKVKLGSETKDMVLLLPIKEPLIIKQKKREKINDDGVYFGVVKLDQYGYSMFNRNLPSDSLALRYQKGYRQFNNDQSYKYEEVKESDVIAV